MTLPAVQQQLDLLDAQFDLVDRLQRQNLAVSLQTALVASLTQYICVRAAGFIEQATRQVYYAYALQRAGSSPLSRFVNTALQRQQNLGSERLCQLAGRFDSTWETDLRAFLTDERSEAVNSILRNRHKIAHGESVSLGFVQMKDWYKRAVEVVKFIEAQAVP